MNKKHEEYMNKPGILITKFKIETSTKITLGIFNKMIRKSFIFVITFRKKMIMKRKLIYLHSTITIVMILFSCSSSEPREVIVNNKFKMQIPTFMHSQKSLNEEASMMYANGVRELYVMALEYTPDQLQQIIINSNLENEINIDLEGFSKLIGFEEGEYFLTPKDLGKLEDITINGLKTKRFENTRKINKVNVYYKVALLKGKNTYYQVIAWTLADRRNKNEKIIGDMINSFEEL